MSKIPVEVGQTISLEIERLTFGGAGLGRYQGFVVFVPLSVPGDLLEVKIIEVKKNFANAALVKIVRPSATRVHPPCPVFGSCGGCEWQHVSYEEQLKAKMQIVLSAIKKAKFSSDVLSILPSSNEWRYRNRIQIQSDGIHVGFKKRSSHEIVSITDCLIAEEDIASKIKTITTPGKTDIRRLPNSEISITKIDTDDTEIGFSQINTTQNQKMIGTISEWLIEYKCGRLFDLYAGAGNLTFPLHEKLGRPETIAIELNRQAVQLGRSRAAGTAIQFIEMSVDDFLRTQNGSFTDDIVIMDPPRTGVSKYVIQKLTKLSPKIIIYVSCDPSTWARDVSTLIEKSTHRYECLRVRPIDMFPQTSHVELISLLVQK